MDIPNRIFEIIHETVEESDNILSISHLCEVGGVSRSGYYAWVNAEEVRAEREKRDEEEFKMILEEFNYKGYPKGQRAIKMRLARREPPVIMSLSKIRRLMNKFRLKCEIRKKNEYRQLIRSIRENSIEDNIVQRQFEMYGPRTILLTDITYIYVPYMHKFVYLSSVLDAFTKEILAHVLSESLEEDFVLETVNILLEKHKLSLSSETIYHSDQGSHYTCHTLRELIRGAGLRKSMSRKGNCWDNAPIESWHGHLKDEIIQKIAKCKTFAEARDEVDKYIDYYNNERPRMDLAMLTPTEYYSFYMTGVYPLKTDNPPERPVAQKSLSELDVVTQKDGSADEDKPGEDEQKSAKAKENNENSDF